MRIESRLVRLQALPLQCSPQLRTEMHTRFQNTTLCSRRQVLERMRQFRCYPRPRHLFSVEPPRCGAATCNGTAGAYSILLWMIRLENLLNERNEIFPRTTTRI